MIGRRPDRRADVQAKVGPVRMAPQRAAARRIEAGHPLAGEQHELLLAVDVDQDRRRGRHLEVARLPDERAALLIERRDRLPRSSDGDDDGAVVEQRAAAVPASRPRRAVLLHEIVGPDTLSGRLVEREQLFPGAHRVQPVDSDERRCVGAGALREIQTVGRRGIFELPHCFSGGGVERGDDLLLAAMHERHHPQRPVHRVDPFPLDEDRRVPFAERAGPEPLRPARRPARRETGRVRHEVPARAAPL